MKVLLGMSGGLDSTYSAHLLKTAGYRVEGAVLRMTDDTDIASAEISAAEIGIVLNAIDARADFAKYVISYFANEYTRGRTPNPCVFCNRYVKIDKLIEYAVSHGFDKVATGHYARVLSENGRYCIARSQSLKKDQSYMLARLTQDQIKKLIFPLEGFEKDNVRERARAMELSSAEVRESQDVCFIPDGDHISFIEGYYGKTFPEGDFLDENGNKVGRHKGIIRYTIGQRKKLGIALGEPVYVSHIDPESNTVTVKRSGGEFGSCMTVCDLVYQLYEEAGEAVYDDLSVKIRYAAQPVPVRVKVSEGKAIAEFAEPARAITPGQTAVFYKGDKIAFSGIIEQ